MKKLILFNLMIWILYFTANLLVLIFLDHSLNDNYLAPYFVYPMGDIEYNVVNLGTSHGEVGFKWDTDNENSHLRGLNLGLSSKPLKYDYFLLKYYESNIDSDALILLPISFHTLCMSNETYTPIDAIYNNNLPLRGMVRLNILWDMISYPTNYPDDIFEPPSYPNSLVPIECDEDKINDSVGYIEKIANIYDNVVLLTTPYHHESLANIEEFNEFYSQVEYIQSLLNLTYYDYSRDLRFKSELYFYNSSHLNSKGRELFTEIVIDEIVNLYINNHN
jgi:hypothetical protein